MGLPEAQLFAVRDRTLEIRCRSVRLAQRGVDAPRVLVGPGLIRMHADGELDATVFVQQTEGSPPPREVILGRRSPPGEFVPESDYYDLEAEDESRGRWRSRRAYPEAPFGIGGAGSILPVRLSLLTRVTDYRGARIPKEAREQAMRARRVLLRFFDEIPFPANLRTQVHTDRGGQRGYSMKVDAAQLDACGLRIQVAREEGITTLVASSDTELAPGLATHLSDALEFILGRPLWPDVEEVHTAGVEEVTIYPPRRSTARVEPPVPRNTAGAEQHTWELFALYLGHLLAEPDKDRRPLAGVWHGVLNVGDGNVEAMALVWSVAVEAILKLTAPAVPDASHNPLLNWRQLALDALDCGSCPPEVRQRFEGLFELLDEPQDAAGPAAKLLRLVEDGALKKGHRAAWKRLRPRTAHGVLDVRKNPQQVYRDTLVVLALLYRLMFRAVGYSGPFRDAV